MMPMHHQGTCWKNDKLQKPNEILLFYYLLGKYLSLVD